MNWIFDRSTRVHSTDGCKVVATVRKDGDTYAWWCPEFDDLPAQGGTKPSLKEAKKAVENWLNKPEPETYICVICGEPIVTRVEWSGPAYTSWAHHMPGAFEMMADGGDLFFVGYRCAACCVKARPEEEEEPETPKTFDFGDNLGYEHRIGDARCDAGWCCHGYGYPTPCEAEGCPGLVHANFGDEYYDGDYWLYTKCDVCGESE